MVVCVRRVCVRQGPGALRLSSRLSPFLMPVMTALVRSDSFTVKEYTDTHTNTLLLRTLSSGMLMAFYCHSTDMDVYTCLCGHLDV